MHARHHACPPPCTPLTMHARHHACPPPCMPPTITTHAPCHACPPVDWILETHFWKYYLAPTSLQVVKIPLTLSWCFCFKFLGSSGTTIYIFYADSCPCMKYTFLSLDFGLFNIKRTCWMFALAPWTESTPILLHHLIPVEHEKGVLKRTEVLRLL